MNKPMLLNGGEIVISDSQKLIAVYPYRDADQSKVTDATRSMTLMVCGCPGSAKKRFSRLRELQRTSQRDFALEDSESPD